MQKEEELLILVTKELGFEPISISSIHHHRWTLIDREGLGPQMMKIEARLHEITKKPIDLRVELKKDKNKRFDRNYLRGIDKL